MRHVGNMHTNLPTTFGQLADRQRIVEVLSVGRVDREGRHIAEIATLGIVLRRDLALDLLGRLDHSIIELIGQVILRQNCVHLRVVVATHTQHIANATLRALAAVGPIDDMHHHLLAITQIGILAFRAVDIHRHLARIDLDKYLMIHHLRRTDITLRIALDDLRDLALGHACAVLARHSNAHTVAVQRIARIAAVDIDILLHTLNRDIDCTRRNQIGNTLIRGHCASCQTEFLTRAGLNNPLSNKPFECIARSVTAITIGTARNGSQLLQREFVPGHSREHVHND